jgi:hypothetical protein
VYEDLKVDCLHPKMNLLLKKKEIREVVKEVSQILLQQDLCLNP